MNGLLDEPIQTTAAAVLSLAAVALGFVKPIVDGIKLALPALPAWVYPLLAMLVANLLVVLLAIASNIQITPQIGAQIVLASIVIATGSVGINRLGSVANDARIQAIGSQVKLKVEATSDSAPTDVTVLNAANSAGRANP